MKERLLEQTKREYSVRKRIALLIIAGVFFLGLFPAAVAFFSAVLDRKLGLPPMAFGAINAVLGWILVAAGFLLGWWTVYVQFTIGRGTPVPIMATQQLIVQKPYSYCRNPMALGAIVAYVGIAIVVGSYSAVALVLALAALLLTYIRVLEEKEMELRFGEAYREYRKQVPFIIPRLRKSN